MRKSRLRCVVRLWWLLGLIVNNHLTWKEHLYGEHWREKGNASAWIEGWSPEESCAFMFEKKFRTICQGIFYPKMSYCLQVVGNVWGVDTNNEVNRRFSAYTKEDNRKLQTLQNMVLRTKTDMPRRTPTKTLLALSGDLSVQQLTAQATLTSLQKVIHNGKPEYLADKLKLNLCCSLQLPEILYQTKFLGRVIAFRFD